jgi:Arc/MetJ-type ribon-helix-helix transcriptional regulator
MTMVAIRLADETVDRIDSLVAGGWTVNRTVFVREAIDAALARATEAVLDQQIATTLDRIEETPAELQALKDSTRAWVASLPDEEW